MFTVGVRDHMMIAHSLKGEVFGPAQRLHGATYVVEVEFRRSEPDGDGIVVDIGLASAALRAILEEFNYRNLDEVPSLAGVNSTTEAMAKVICDRMKAAIAAGDLGPGAAGLKGLKVTLQESHIAWAGYEESL